MNKERIKKHTVREDGRIFHRYMQDKEIWLTPEQFKKREQSIKNYVKKCFASYKKKQEQKNIMDRNYFGKYNFATNKYFAGITSSGKERWVSKEQLDNIKFKANERRKKFLQEQKKIEKPNLKVGDKNPENSLEVVIYFIGGKPYFSSVEHYEIIKENRRISQRKQLIKAAKIRKQVLLQLKQRIVRGTKHESENLIFWCYGSTGKEIWLPAQEYDKRWKKEQQKKKKYRK